MTEKHKATHEHGAEDQINSAEMKARQNEILENAKKEASEARNLNQEKLDDIREEIDKTANTTEMLASETKATEEGLKTLKKFVENVNSNNVYFVIGHKMQGYEKALVDISKELNMNFIILIKTETKY